MSGPAGRAGRLALGVMAVVAAAAVGAVPASAQAAPIPAPGYSLALTSQTAWVASPTNGDFRMGLRVAAADSAGTRLAVTVYQRVTSRSDFNESVAGRIHTGIRHAFRADSVASQVSGPDGTVTVDFAVNPSPAIAGQDSLRVVSPGVYPVEVTLIDRNDQTLARMVTHLLYAGGSPASQPRLDVAWALPVHAPPAFTADGQADRLPAATAQPINDLVAALGRYPDVPVTLTATAQTLEALAATNAAGRQTISALAQLAAGTSAEVVDRPYVSVNLPAMVGSGLDGELTAQLRRAGETLSSTLHVRPDTRTWVEGGPLDLPSVDALVDRGIDRLMVDDNVLSPVPADLRNTTLAQPFILQGRGDRQVTAVAADAGLAAHFHDGDQVLAAHQLLADLAIIQGERPANLRGVAILTPSTWRPDATFLEEVLAGLANSPLLSPVTVDKLFADIPQAQEHHAPLERTVSAQQSIGAVPDAAVVRTTRHRLDALSTMLPAGSTTYSDIERPLLIGQSADLGSRDQAAEIAAAARMVDQQTRFIRLPANTSITLTARQGRFPVTIISTAPYQARVQIQLKSKKLEFSPIDDPGATCRAAGGTEEICNLDLRTQNTTLKVPVVARTAGVFSVTINLATPDGGLILASSEDTVRSTAASGVGIFLSVGAALLLAAWWARDLRHGRRARGLVPAAPGGAPLGEAPPGLAGLDTLEVDGDDWLVPELPPPDGRRSGIRPSKRSRGMPRQARGAGTITTAVGPPRPAPVAGAEPAAPPGRPPASSGAAPAAPSGRPPVGPASSGAAPAAPPARPPASAPQPGTEGTGGPGRRRPRPPGTDGRSNGPATALASPPSSTPPPDRPGMGGAALPASFSRNSFIMASGTLLSRLSGFARVLALVYAFHLTRLADIYNLANTAPNILYDLVLGGVLSATLVPVFVDWFGRAEEEAWRAVSAVVTAITVTLAVLTAIFWLLAPAIIRLYLVLDHSPGGADQRALGTSLLRLFAPQLFLLGGIALTTALLNARRQFFVTAYSPVINNLVTVAAIVAARMVAASLELSAFRRDALAVLILGLGTTSGYLVQLLAQVPSVIRGGLRLRPVWDLHHPAVRTVLRLSLWTFGSVLTNQIAFNLVLILAARKSGDVTAFQTAFQFFQLPYAIFAVSIASVLTPDLADRWARADVGGFRRQLASGVRLTLAVVVPAAVGYVLLARPAIALFVRHGGVGSSAAHLIGTVVALFAVGLPGFSVYLLLMRAYQAMQDTRSMFWLYALENGLTIVLAMALYPVMGVGGLALGWVGAYSIGAVAAFAHLRGRTAGLEGRATAASLIRIAVASAMMAAAVAAIMKVAGGPSKWLGPRVGIAVVAGAFLYFFVGRALDLAELRSLGDLRRSTT